MKPATIPFIIAFLFSLVSGFALATPKPSPDIPDGASNQEDTVALATFAGGCFWCMEPPFDQLEGVLSTTSGYVGGHVENPSYKQVTQGNTGHFEVLQVEYDPSKVSYEQLLNVFWKNIDPLDARGQFCDKGPQYRSAIFYHDKSQLNLARKSLQSLQEQKFKEPIATEILSVKKFYPAEDYHQDYYQKNPLKYKYYRWGCKRDERLEELWGE